MPAPRSAAVNSLKTGMMQNFKSSFVSASSSNTPSNSAPSRGAPSSFVRPALRGFVSGGTIGGDANQARAVQPAPSFVPASRPAENTVENAKPNPERCVPLHGTASLVILLVLMTRLLYVVYANQRSKFSWIAARGIARGRESGRRGGIARPWGNPMYQNSLHFCSSALMKHILTVTCRLHDVNDTISW